MFGKRGTAASKKPIFEAPPPDEASEEEAQPAPALKAVEPAVEVEVDDAETTPLESAPADEEKPEAKSEEQPAPPPDERNDGPLSEKLQEVKVTVFNDLIEAVDLTQLAALDSDAVLEEIGDIVSEIISMRNLVLSAQEQQQVINDICNDVLGLGPLEPLIARDDIADIMVNGPDKVYIETGGKIELTDIKFRDNAQLMNICQRIVTAVGRRVDEASPICDARLLDGSRVNVIAPPLAVDGAALTIRKFS